jgi:hypothetical protein
MEWHAQQHGRFASRGDGGADAVGRQPIWEHQFHSGVQTVQQPAD